VVVFRAMKWTLLLGVCLAASFCLAAKQGAPDLAALYKDHHWFALRDAVQAGNSPLFYRAAVEAVFNQSEATEKDLREVIAAAPHGHDAYEAHTLLAGLYLRTGQYREALAHTEALLAEMPDAADVKNIQPLFRVLSETPDQSVIRKQISTVPVQILDGNLLMRVSINGSPATYALDTDADLSLLSESEAKRLGFPVRDVGTSIDGMSGNGIKPRVAVANTLTVGNVRLAHVAFYVLPDSQPPFNDMAEGTRGILGIPVILALQTVRWRAQAQTLECAFPLQRTDIRQANLAFDGGSPVVQVNFQRQALEFSFDTGAQKTDLYPAFAKKFADLVNATGKKESHTLTGVDGSASFDSVELPSITLQVGGHDAVLKPAHVLMVEHNAGSQWYFGNLGVDLLNQASSVTMDFRSMTLTLQ
jgi:tetratricopeptide (TPR) repeat protein